MHQQTDRSHHRAAHAPSAQPIFCCRSCYTHSSLRGRIATELFRFGWHMMNTSPAGPGPSDAVPASAAVSATRLAQALEQAAYVIRVERFRNAERDSIRFFCPDPASDEVFLELAPAMVAPRAGPWVAPWVGRWEYLKFRCDVHEGPWFNCHILQRGKWEIETVPLVEYELDERRGGGHEENEGRRGARGSERDGDNANFQMEREGREEGYSETGRERVEQDLRYSSDESGTESVKTEKPPRTKRESPHSESRIPRRNPTALP